MKIVVVGLGTVGLSNAVLLAQHNEVIGVDISQERVDALNCKKSPIVDTELTDYLERRKLNLIATTDLKTSVPGDVGIVRIFNTYGPLMDLDDGRVVTSFIKSVINGEQLTVFGDGQQTRSLCYVDDLISGLVK